MKDVSGKDIKVGDRVVYMISVMNKHFEKAIVIESEECHIRVEYLGIPTNKKTRRKVKEEGKKSRLTVTDKKIIVTNKGTVTGRCIYIEERKRFEEKIKKVESKLEKALYREIVLASENASLQAEVDKIHDRWNILDL